MKVKHILQNIIQIFKKILKKIIGYFLSRRFVIFLRVLLGGLVLAYFVLLFFANEIETAITFPGKDINLKQISNHPAWLIAAEEVFLTSTNGHTIHGIYIDNGAAKTVYYFHGNGAPMDHFFTEMRYIADLWYNLIAYDFPGYGKSGWEPTQEEAFDFSTIFYENMKTKLGFEDSDMIVWGYSVGTAVAIDFAKDKDFDCLMLFSPLASRYDMSKKVFNFPIQKLFFLPNSFISKESIKLIDEPTFVIHGNKDIVVPFEQWKIVYEASPASQKYFLEIDDLWHSLITERYGEVLSWYIETFLTYHKLEVQKTFLDRELATELLRRFQDKEYIKNLDLDTDTSYTKYIDPSIPFKDLSYIPDDMKDLSWDYIIDLKWNAQLREKAAWDFEKMAKDFHSEFWEQITVVSSYRSYAYQAWIKSRGCPDNLCAKAGYSEHQSGLALDLWSASTNEYWQSSKELMKYYEWLKNNAHLYGFHNSYQNGREVDGYEIEPWHWRYVWQRFATYLHENGETFAQYYYKR